MTEGNLGDDRKWTVDSVSDAVETSSTTSAVEQQPAVLLSNLQNPVRSALTLVSHRSGDDWLPSERLPHQSATFLLASS